MDTPPRPTTGQVWKDKETNVAYSVLGFRSNQKIAVTPVIGDTQVQWLSLDEMINKYEYVSCDHTNFCCTTHKKHTSPHRGCMLR